MTDDREEQTNVGAKSHHIHERGPGRSPTKFPQTSRGEAPANPLDKYLRLGRRVGKLTDDRPMMTDDRKEQTKVGANGEAQARLRKQVGAKPQQVHFTGIFDQGEVPSPQILSRG